MENTYPCYRTEGWWIFKKEYYYISDDKRILYSGDYTSSVVDYSTYTLEVRVNDRWKGFGLTYHIYHKDMNSVVETLLQRLEVVHLEAQRKPYYL